MDYIKLVEEAITIIEKNLTEELINDFISSELFVSNYHFQSHRLSSCRFCNQIIVFDNGEIVQRGSHEELVKDEKGKYHELWYAQAQYYAE